MDDEGIDITISIDRLSPVQRYLIKLTESLDDEGESNELQVVLKTLKMKKNML